MNQRPKKPTKQELEALRDKIVKKVLENPNRAASLLTQWLEKKPAPKKVTVRKKAA
jgi:hypothetical protein